MFEHFNFGIFLTTLGIASVAHAIGPEILAMLESQHTTNNYPYINNNGGRIAPKREVLSTSFQTGSSSFNSNNNQRPFSVDDAMKFESEIRRIKGQNPISDDSGSVIYKCWTNGQSRIIQKGDSCNGTLQIVNGKNTSQDTPRPSPFEKIEKSPLPTPNRFPPLNIGSFRLPQLNRNSVDSPLSSSSSTNSPLTNENSLKPSTQHSFNNNSPPQDRNQVLSFQKKNENIALSSAQKSDDYSHLQKLFNDNITDEPTEVTPASQNPSLTKESKQYTLPDGSIVQASMPQEIPVQYHSYESALRLDDREVCKIRDEVLKQTNFYRQMYGINPLTLNENMNNHAQEWANKLSSLKKLRRRTATENNLYGENLYSSTPLENIGEEAVKTWYNELRFINVNDGEEELRNNPHNIGHLVQLLWKTSKQMGVGVAKSDDNYYFIVADYNPKGDVYPFLKDNLPSFKESDIEAAEKAHKASPGEVFSNDNNHIPEPVSTSISPKPSASDDYYKNTKAPKPHPYVQPIRLTPKEVEVIRTDVFNKSNMYRRQYGLEPLVLNDQISNYSQEWANYLASTNKFEHRPNDGTRIYGENLHISQNVLHVGELAVDLWYYEIGLVNVDDDNEVYFENDAAGHLTQLLWKASKQMGCGAAVNEKGKVVIAANYNPTGNVQNLYLENLPKFTQKQIDEGKRLQKVIDDLKAQPRQVSTVQTGQKQALPGWKSALYN